MRDKRSVDELSLEELERLVIVRRCEERRKRLRQVQGSSVPKVELPSKPPKNVQHHDDLAFLQRAESRRSAANEQQQAPASWRDRLLLLLEILALGGLIVAVVLFVADRPGRVSEAADGVAVTPQVAQAGGGTGDGTTPAVLPGRPPAPPDTAGVALPALYTDRLDTTNQNPQPVVLDETEAQKRPVRIVIPSIEVDAPIVPGDDWEALKKGVGHHFGSALPGERGNMVLSAHNDIFGEIFRYLNEVKQGDEVIVYDGAGRQYRYVVAVKRIVEPTAVEVLEQTNEPVATLITCYPYLVDTERLVVVAELQ